MAGNVGKGGRFPAFKAGDVTAARALMKEGKLPVHDVTLLHGPTRWRREPHRRRKLRPDLTGMPTLPFKLNQDCRRHQRF